MLVELNGSQNFKYGKSVALRIVEASDQQWAGIVHELAARRELGRAVRQINRMLEDPAHEDLARSALARIGLMQRN